MTSSLRAAFAAASPRITPRPAPLVSMLIYLAVLAAWAILFARALWLDNVWAWSAGIAYILYDTVLMAVVTYQTWPLRHAAPAAAAAAPDARPTLGIVIAAHNAAADLPAALAAIFTQSDPPDLVLIADDGSSDGTAALLAASYGLAAGSSVATGATHPTLRWLALPHLGKAQALNAALVQMSTDIVVTLDADTFLERDAVRNLRDAFAQDRALVAAGGVLVPICDASLTGRAMQFFQTYEYIRNMISRFAWMRIDSLLLISGAFAGFRREALLAVGGFDPDCLVEDYELTHRMHRYALDHDLRWRLAMVGSAMARTEAPSAIPAFMRQRRRWFAGFLQTQFWNRDMTGNSRYGALGTRMLPIKAIDTLQPVYGLTAFVLLLVFIATGQADIAVSVGGLILAKIVADFLNFMWSIHLYRRLTGGRTDANFPAACVAALLEPFSFQLLRHAGAAWGWIAFLRGSKDWGRASVTAQPRAERGR